MTTDDSEYEGLPPTIDEEIKDVLEAIEIDLQAWLSPIASSLRWIEFFLLVIVLLLVTGFHF